MTKHGSAVGVWMSLMQAQVALEENLGARLEHDAGLPLTWFDVLMRLDEAEGGRMRMQELIGAALLSKSGITRLCDRIEAAGYIRRLSCATDRRGVHAEITPAGRAVVEKARAVFEEAVTEHIGAHLDEAEQRDVAEALGKLATSNPCSRLPRTEGAHV